MYAVRIFWILKQLKNLNFIVRSKLLLPIKARSFAIGFLVLSIPFGAYKGWSQSIPTPIYQTDQSDVAKRDKQQLSLWDASRNDRWLGRSPENIRWSVDGDAIYFQWTQNPLNQPYHELDPWFKASSGGRSVEIVPSDQVHLIPGDEVVWDAKHRKASWVNNGVLYVFDGSTRPIVRWDRPIRAPYFLGEELHFVDDQGQLFAHHFASGFLEQLTTVHPRGPAKESEAEQWLKAQQTVLFDGIRQRQSRSETLAAHRLQTSLPKPLSVPLGQGWQIISIAQSPNREKIIYSLRKNHLADAPTYYMDYASESGYAMAHPARAKVGEKDNEYRMEIMDFNPRISADSIRPVLVDYSALTSDQVIFHGPFWSPNGTKALVQLSSLKHKDRWIGELDLETAKIRSIIHDHDDAWLGGPEVVGYYSLRPVFMEWINDDQFVFASERTGFAHLYQSDLEGKVKALTQGTWEVRQAKLNNNRNEILVTTGKDDPCQDHLYVLSLKTGALKKISDRAGRNTGYLSPDGNNMAVLHSGSVQVPDLYCFDLQEEVSRRVTVSGTKNYYQTDLVQPEMVQFPHRDGKPVWAALFKPKQPHPKKPAILHIHGGGYRQFSHKGWSVYGYATHLSMINYLVQEGYTVLDLDYRGSAGFGRDYRTDIYRTMGVKDVESGLAGIDYLVKEHGIDPDRIGVYGISYGGFFTLMALFKHPGKFAAGIANASVADWAHYNYLWTSRILNLPQDDPEAYQVSSPINHAAGLQDPLLIVHGIIDDNVHFQDAVRVTQKLIELEKDFEIMYYPQERHVIQHEAARYDYHKRLVTFFKRHLLK